MQTHVYMYIYVRLNSLINSRDYTTGGDIMGQCDAQKTRRLFINVVLLSVTLAQHYTNIG